MTPLTPTATMMTSLASSSLLASLTLLLLLALLSLLALSSMFFALVALVFIGPTSRVVLVRLKANLESSSFIPLYKQVQTCSGLALVQTGSNLFKLDLYKHVWNSEFFSVL